MKLKILLAIFVMLGLCSCARPPMHELTSPCTAADPIDGSGGKHPCVRRKVNDNWLA